MSRTAVGVLISGRGSNMEALIDAARDEAYPARIAVVIANNPDATGLAIARAAGVPALAIDHRPFGQDREAHERQIDLALRHAEVEVVALAGYMRVLSPFLVGAWEGRMLNIHPSLLPAYPGLHTHQRAIDAGDLEAGCSVHVVTTGVDEGPVVGQARVPVLPHDDAASLANRVLAKEHKLYRDCLAAFVRSLRPA